MFLPSNKTSICQLLNQGIIKTWKTYYHCQWLQYMIIKLDAYKNPHKTVNILQALH